MIPPVYKLQKLEALRPYERNARTHSPGQVAQLAASMKEFGFTNPILVDEAGQIIAGHGRLEGARQAGLTEVPTLVLHGLSKKQKRALVLADNKLALNAGWDLDLLRSELKELKTEGFDLALTGFSNDEFLDLMGGTGPDGSDPDVVPEGTVAPRAKPGELWVLGNHRVFCGDSTVQDSYSALLGGERVDIVWTDPPYNVAYEGSAGKIKNDDMDDASFFDFLFSMYQAVFNTMKMGAPIYVAHADTEGLNFRKAFAAAGFKLSGCLVWRKDSLVLGRSDYQWQHEPVLYGWKPGDAHPWYGGRKQTTLLPGTDLPFVQLEDGRWSVKVGDRMFIVSGDAKVEEMVPSVVYCEKPKKSGEHPTMKPVALIERMLTNSARSGALVLDPFGGSGSTLMAADRLGMRARLIELDPKFVDVIVARWENYSGRKATVEKT